VTIREIFVALWRRKWIIVAVTVLAAIVAVVYLQRLTPNYVSSVTVRFGPVVTQAISTGELGGVTVNLDPSVVTSPDVLDPAAKAIGEPKGSLYGKVTYAQDANASSTNAATTSVTLSVAGPDPVEAQKRATAVVRSLTAYVDGVMSSTLQTLQANYIKVGKEAATYRSQFVANPNDPTVQANLATATNQLTTLGTQIATLQNAGASVIVTAPASPGVSTNPSLLIVFALAIVCGLIAGMGVALIRDHFDERLRDEDDLEAALGVPILGTLPADRAVARRRERLPAGSARHTVLSEGIRSLRTTMQVLLPHGKGVLVITSVEPGDGKTFLSANVALSWARAGRKVILVGGDLRRPSLAAYFPDAVGGPGLGGLLFDAGDGTVLPPQREQIAAALRNTPYRGLRVLPGGEDIADPGDLLAEEGLASIVRLLAGMADVVVIDTPPALGLADASLLAAEADGVVLLASVGRTRRNLIGDALESLRANGANVYGIVVNRARRRVPKSYQAYYMHSGSSRPASAPFAVLGEPDDAEPSERHEPVEDVTPRRRAQSRAAAERLEEPAADEPLVEEPAVEEPAAEADAPDEAEDADAGDDNAASAHASGSKDSAGS